MFDAVAAVVPEVGRGVVPEMGCEVVPKVGGDGVVPQGGSRRWMVLCRRGVPKGLHFNSRGPLGLRVLVVGGGQLGSLKDCIFVGRTKSDGILASDFVTGFPRA